MNIRTPRDALVMVAAMSFGAVAAAPLNAQANTQEEAGPGVAKSVETELAAEMLSFGPRYDTTYWDCFLNNGRFVGRITVEWGEDPVAAGAQCSHWISACATEGGCFASGSPYDPDACHVQGRLDGCSLSLNDPSSNAYKEIFRDACNVHDACYQAPWGRINDDGFKICNDNFWNDMNAKCNTVEWYNQLPCRVVASTWADAMNFYPLRKEFETAFENDQQWVQDTCVY